MYIDVCLVLCICYGRDLFLLHDSEDVVKSEAGGMKVVKGMTGKFVQKPMHIGFIIMEPKSLFIPQYLDSTNQTLIIHSIIKTATENNYWQT